MWDYEVYNMKAHTMQEIADFFGCRVAKDTRGTITFFNDNFTLQISSNLCLDGAEGSISTLVEPYKEAK